METKCQLNVTTNFKSTRTVTAIKFNQVHRVIQKISMDKFSFFSLILEVSNLRSKKRVSKKQKKRKQQRKQKGLEANLTAKLKIFQKTMVSSW